MKTLARDADASELLERATRLQPDATRQWGRMSAPQMVCHVSDSFRMALGERPVSDATTLAGRTIVKWIALYAPLSWPAGIMTVPEVDQELRGTCPADFAADVTELQRLLRRMASCRTRHDWPAHPIFGPLTGAAWLRWGYLHTDHHFRQFGT